MEDDAVLILVKGEVAVEGLVNTEKLFVHPERNFPLKKLVVVANRAAAEVLKYIHFAHSSVNQ